MLAFLVKAAVNALKEFPEFNASLDRTGDNLIIKRYYHIGVAVDTPEGLLVPVLKDADRKGVFDLARSSPKFPKRRARRSSGLTPCARHFQHLQPGRNRRHRLYSDHQRAEVAILGVARSQMRPCSRTARSFRG